MFYRVMCDITKTSFKSITKDTGIRYETKKAAMDAALKIGRLAIGYHENMIVEAYVTRDYDEEDVVCFYEFVDDGINEAILKVPSPKPEFLWKVVGNVPYVAA